MSRVRTQLVIDGKNNSKQAFDEVRKDLDALDKRIDQAGKAVVAFLSVQTLVGAVRTIANASDAWVEMTDRIKLATQSDAEYAESLDELRKISDRTFTSMTNNAEVYINSLSVLRERGFSNREALQFTETIGLGLVASAAKGERATQVINQFSKALQQGKLQGDSFNAMVNNAPALTDALARGLGKTREELAKMATDGKLTTDVFVPALLGQMDSLGKAVDGMNIVVSDALTRLKTAWDQALGQADMTPLVQSIEGLTKTISDPTVMANLIRLASSLATLGSWAAFAGSEFVQLADGMAYTAAQAAAASDAELKSLEKLKRTLKEVEAARTGSSFLGSSTTALLMKYFAPDQLDEWADELKGKIQGIEMQLFGISSEEVERATSEMSAAREADIANHRQYVAELKRLQGETVKATQDAIKQQMQAEKAAQRDLEKVRSDRLKIEQRYQEALAGMSGGGDASYGNAQALKVGARQALQAGDVEGAQRQAQAALKMLQDLQAAGENTYGFGGFIQELQAIELAANDIEQTRAEDKITAIGVSIAALQDQAKQLEGMPVSVTADEASIEAVRTQIQNLAAQLGQTEIVLPVRITAPDASAPTSALMAGIDGYAKGTNNAPPGMAWVGENGPELVNFRGGEQVLTAAASRNLASRMQGIALQDLAGGSAGDIAASTPASTPGRDLGRVTLDLGGGRTVEVLATQPEFDRINALKFGRTHKR